MPASRKSRRKGFDVKELLDPTFSVPVRGTRQRMPAYEIILRKEIKKALEAKEPKAVYDLINLFIEHQVIKPKGSEIPSTWTYPWYWDSEDFHRILDEAKKAGKAPDPPSVTEIHRTADRSGS